MKEQSLVPLAQPIHDLRAYAHSTSGRQAPSSGHVWHHSLDQLIFAPLLRAEDLALIKRRTKEEGVSVMGLRFTADPLCPGARFRTLEKELGGAFESIEIDSGLGNRWGIPPWAHSVLTNDLVDEAGHPTRVALDRVLGFFDRVLKSGGCLQKS